MHQDTKSAWLIAVCKRSFSCEILVRKSRGLCEKTEWKYFPIQIEQTRLIRLLLYGFWFIFSLFFFCAVFVFWYCRLPYLWACWFRSLFTLVRHSFTLLIDKQLSRKATLIFQGVLLLELFQRTYLIFFYFHLKNIHINSKIFPPKLTCL